MAIRSVIPTVFDQTARGDRAFDICSLLFRDRTIFAGQEVVEQIANVLLVEILCLGAEEPERGISLYVDTPGGRSHAGMAVYDVRQHVSCDASTICVDLRRWA